jgi:hypothetical protein
MHEQVHLFSCDAFIPLARKDPPDKPENCQEVVSEDTTSVVIHSHDEIAAFPLFAPEPTTIFPSTSFSPVSPKYDLISKKDQPTLTQTTHDNKTYKAETEASNCHRILDVDRARDPLIHARDPSFISPLP